MTLSQWEYTGFGSVVRTLLDWALKVGRPGNVRPNSLVLDEWDLSELAVVLDRKKRGPEKESAAAKGVTVVPPAEAPAPVLPPPAPAAAVVKVPRGRKKPAVKKPAPATKPGPKRKAVKS